MLTQTFPSAFAAAISESDTLFAGAGEVFFSVLGVDFVASASLVCNFSVAAAVSADAVSAELFAPFFAFFVTTFVASSAWWALSGGNVEIDLIYQSQILVAFGILDLIDADRIDLSQHPVLQPERWQRFRIVISSMARKRAAVNLYHKLLQNVSRGIDNAARQERSDLASPRCSFQRLARNLPESVGLLIKSTVMRVRFPLPTESDHD